MTQFMVFALLLVLVATAFLLPPLWLGQRATGAKADRKAANLAIFRDQLNELERERAAGTLADAEFEQGQRELQRRLLEEVEPDTADTPSASHAPSRKLAVALFLLLPILSLAGYGLLGNPRALDPAQTVAQPKMTPEQINAMVARLAERMQLTRTTCRAG